MRKLPGGCNDYDRLVLPLYSLKANESDCCQRKQGDETDCKGWHTHTNYKIAIAND